MADQNNVDLALMRQEFARREDVDREVDNVEGRLGNQIRDVKIDLKGDIQGVKTDLEGDIRNVKTDLENNIQGVKTDLEGDIRNIKTDLENNIQGVKTDLLGRQSLFMWFIGAIILVGGIIANLVSPLLSKLFSP